MSCPRCGGVLTEELSIAMVELVCGMVVIEGRFCHCDDAEDTMRAKLPPDGDGTLDGQSHGLTSSEGSAP